jgi:GTP pyrophosphokinase
VDGSIVPLTYQLQTGERVEILTAKQPNPSRYWMNPHTGYLKTPRARAKVQQWFRALEAVEAEKIKDKEKDREKEIPLSVNQPEFMPIKKSTAAPSKKASQDIQILGVGHLLTQMAKCCKPLPGEPIMGYITQGKGVSIHRKNCQNVLHVHENAKNKLIEVDWGEKISNVYPVEIKIEAYDRQGLLRDISAFFANEKINVVGIQSFTDKASNEAHLYTTLEISSQAQLQQLLIKLRQIQNVIRADRR